MRIPRANLRYALLFSLSGLMACGQQGDKPQGPPGKSPPAPAIERFQIEGGPSVVLVRIEGVPRVAVQAMYDVGIIDEPDGIPQASHLIEHMACMGETAKSPCGETFAQLNRIGMANAETLPSFTHYDYGLPADRLELAFQSEAERLRSLVIDRRIVASEAPRCYEEVRMVSSHTPPALGKFALMAATQSWRHGLRSAKVQAGLESAPLSRVRAFHSKHYNRRNLILVIVGPVQRESALKLVKKHFGDLPSPAPAAEPIDWKKSPKLGLVAWDAPATIVYVAFPPPSEPAEQLVMTALVQMAAQTMQADPQVQELAAGVDSSNMVWPVGRAPGFAAFTLKPGVRHAAAVPLLAVRFQAALEAQEPNQIVQILPMLADLPWTLDAASLKTNAEQLVQQMGSLERAQDAVLGNSAIQIGLKEIWLGPDRAPILERARAIVRDDWKGFLKRAFSEDRRIVTVLLPTGK